jgi:hypothetical protein
MKWYSQVGRCKTTGLVESDGLLPIYGPGGITGGSPALDPGRGKGTDGNRMARTPTDHLDLPHLAGLLVDPDAAHGGVERAADQGPASDRVANADEVPPGRNARS